MTVEQLEVVITANTDDLEEKMSVVNTGLVQLEQNALSASAIGIGALQTVADKIAETDWSLPDLDEAENLIDTKSSKINILNENSIESNNEDINDNKNELNGGINSKKNSNGNISFESITAGKNAALSAYKTDGGVEYSIDDIDSTKRSLEAESSIDNIVSAEPFLKAENLETDKTDSVYSGVVNYYNNNSEAEIFGYNKVTDVLSVPDNDKIEKQGANPITRKVYNKEDYIGNAGGETRIVLEVDGDVLAETVLKNQNSRMIRTNGMYM